MFNSIKLRLFVWLLVIFTIIFTGFGIFLYYEIKGFSLGQVDDQLKTSLQTINGIMLLEESHGQLQMELWELSNVTTGEYAERLSGHYYQILTPDGEILARSPSLGLANATLPIVEGTEEPMFQTGTGPDNTPLRLISQSIQLSSATLIIEIGNSLKDTYSLLDSFKKIIVIVLPMIFMLSGLAGLIITGRALRPLKTFSSEIGQITEESLKTRIEENSVVTELRPLAESFNTMLVRIEGAFWRQQQFLSDASHELRTPTSIIKSYCDVTLRRERTAPEYRDALRKIEETVNRMCDIINRILVISRLDSKTIRLNPVRMDLMEVLKDVIRLVEPAALNRDIKMSLNGKPVTVLGDREGITEVFTNVVENAVKYNRPGGSVDMDIGEDNGRAIVTVKDTGIGIPAEEIPKIFDRFYRVDMSRGQTVGSGLGLSIVKGIIEAHGGRIDVESAVGRGSTFRVSLPKDFEFKTEPLLP